MRCILQDNAVLNMCPVSLDLCPLLFHQALLLYLRELHPPQETASASSAVPPDIPPCFHGCRGHWELLAIPRAQGETCPLRPGNTSQLPPPHAHGVCARPSRDGGPPRARPGRAGSGQPGELHSSSDQPPSQRGPRVDSGFHGFGSVSAGEPGRSDQPLGGGAPGAAGEDRNLPKPAEGSSGEES